MAEVYIMPNVSEEQAASIFRAFDPLRKRRRSLRRSARILDGALAGTILALLSGVIDEEGRWIAIAIAVAGLYSVGFFALMFAELRLAAERRRLFVEKNPVWSKFLVP